VVIKDIFQMFELLFMHMLDSNGKIHVYAAAATPIS